MHFYNWVTLGLRVISFTKPAYRLEQKVIQMSDLQSYMGTERKRSYSHESVSAMDRLVLRVSPHRDSIARNILMESHLLTDESGRYLSDVRELQAFDYRSKSGESSIFSRMRTVSARAKEKAKEKALEPEPESEPSALPRTRSGTLADVASETVKQASYYDKFKCFDGVYCTDPDINLKKLLPVTRCVPPASS